MKPKLKKLQDQVIVITGASSGIGLATARAAASAGARVVVAARNDEALTELVEELRALGRLATQVVADVAIEADVDRIVETAMREFGRIDTWVNNAGVSIYGRVMEVTLEDARRLFETNFWGLVLGSRAAVNALRAQGGALINIGSVVSDRAVPLQGIYSASKHAVKGFTDALRVELEEEGLPISVSLIKPSAIDTPYTEHAKNYLEVEPTNPAPLYAPHLVAEAILHAAQNPIRDLFVGGGGAAIAAAGRVAPRLTDRIMGMTLFKAQRTNRKKPGLDSDGLHQPGEGGREYGLGEGPVLERSLYTQASMHPLLTSLLVTGGVAAAALLSVGLRDRSLAARAARAARTARAAGERIVRDR